VAVREWLQDYLHTNTGDDLPPEALPDDEEIVFAEDRLGRPLTDAEQVLGVRMLRWLRIRRTWAGWRDPLLPTDADIVKSALFERLRSGREPLDFPPPIGLDCPWYAVVEDPGPHRADTWGIEFEGRVWAGPGEVAILKNIYLILERVPEQTGNPQNPTDQVFTIQDKYPKDSPYRFRLWYEEEEDIRRPNKPETGGMGGSSIIIPLSGIGKKRQGAWLMQNLVFHGSS
jgi:hypothetical protein